MPTSSTLRTLDIAPTTASTDWLPTGLAMAEGLPFEEWQKMGATLATMELGVNWWIGDWLNYGESQYGEKYAQAIQETGRRRQTLANLAWVAGQIELSRRRDNLAWSLHAEVAKLDPTEQDRILDQAEAHGWSVRETREAVQSRQKAVPASGSGNNLAPAGDSAPAPSSDSRAEGEPAPAPEPAVLADTGPSDDADLVAELERADAEIRSLQSLVDSLQSTDHGREIARLGLQYRQLEGRVQQLMTESNEAKRQAKRQGELLRKVREVLGVERDGEILPRLMEVAR